MSGSPSTSAPPELRTLARLWSAVGGAIVVVVVLVLLTSDATSTVPAALPALLTLAVAAGAVAGVTAVDRTLAASPPADDPTARSELRTRAYLQLAIVEAPVLLGVALGFTLGPPWVATLGGAGALAGLAVARPTRDRLARFDEAWRAAGHDVSLLRDLDEGGAPAG